MDELKKEYNAVLEKQLYFFNLIKSNQLENESSEDFEARYFGLTQEDYYLMKSTKERAERIISELRENNIEMDAITLLTGFKEVV